MDFKIKNSLLIKSLDFSQTSEVRSQNMQLPIMKVAANPYGEFSFMAMVEEKLEKNK